MRPVGTWRRISSTNLASDLRHLGWRQELLQVGLTALRPVGSGRRRSATDVMSVSDDVRLNGQAYTSEVAVSQESPQHEAGKSIADEVKSDIVERVLRLSRSPIRRDLWGRHNRRTGQLNLMAGTITIIS